MDVVRTTNATTEYLALTGITFIAAFSLKLFVDRLMSMKISSTAVIPKIEGKKTHPSAVTIKPVVYRIILTEKSGRFEND